MSESITSLLVIFSEVAVLLAVVIGVIAYFFVKRGRRDKVLAKTLVETLKENEPVRRERLAEVLQKVHQLDEEAAKKSVDTLMECEKELYSKVLQIFLGRDREAITRLHKQVNSLSESYRKLTESVVSEEEGKYHSEDNPLLQAQLRAQIKQLEKEKEKLQRDLNEAMESMDSMLREYTQMYSGGGAKREGLKHLENELSQLKQKIYERDIEDAEEGGDEELPVVDEEVPELEVKESDEAKKE